MVSGELAVVTIWLLKSFAAIKQPKTKKTPSDISQTDNLFMTTCAQSPDATGRILFDK